jgi:hypothetical protein
MEPGPIVGEEQTICEALRLRPAMVKLLIQPQIMNEAGDSW